jgi:hypothetical protein
VSSALDINHVVCRCVKRIIGDLVDQFYQETLNKLAVVPPCITMQMSHVEVCSKSISRISSLATEVRVRLNCEQKGKANKRDRSVSSLPNLHLDATYF